MRKYKAIFSDIDGTLLDPTHKVTSATKDKIEELAKENIPFVLVSARPPLGMVAIRDEISSKYPMICYSGALIVDEELNPIYSATLETEVVKSLYENISHIGDDISFNIYTGRSWKVEDDMNPWVKQEADITGLVPEKIEMDDKAWEGVYKVLCMGDSDAIDSLENVLVSNFPDICIYKSKPTYLEIMSKAASKSNAIEFLRDNFEVSRGEIVAFGDSFNDIDMLKYAGLGVAMGNADEQVKYAADVITESNANEGLLRMLEQIFV